MKEFQHLDNILKIKIRSHSILRKETVIHMTHSEMWQIANLAVMYVHTSPENCSYNVGGIQYNRCMHAGTQ